MAMPPNYDADLHMMKIPPRQIDDEVVSHLRFLRWALEQEQDHQDGCVIGESTGLVVDFLAEKEKREQEKMAVA